VQQTSSRVHSSHHATRSLTEAQDEECTLMRGLVHGVILSTVVWTAVLYLTIVLG
jgi:hypothetical protein